MSQFPGYETSDNNKVWGNTEVIFTSTRFSKHLLSIVENGYCSLHYHVNRSNEFIISSGCLEIFEFYGPEIRKYKLTDGNKHIVPSMVPHLFYAHSDTVALEEYFPDRGGIVDDSDIIRLTLGGKDTYISLMDMLRRRFGDAIRY